MPGPLPRSPAALVVALVLAATAAAAQTPDNPAAPPSQQQHQRGQSRRQPKAASMPEVKVAPQPWPRLDPGAVICRTADDLRQHFVTVAARLDGLRAAEPAGCRWIQVPTPVDVLAREGQGRTRVRNPASPDETGWTDAFLPDKPASR